MKTTPWSIIDTQEDLDRLNQSVCWEDSSTLEFYGSIQNEPYFPSDVSRSGHLNKNIHVLCRSDSPKGYYLELVLIDCDWLWGMFLNHVFLSGKVDSLKRVDIRDGQGSTVMRCSRLIYRFLDDVRVAYYRRERE